MLEGQGINTGCPLRPSFVLERMKSTMLYMQVLENTVKWMARVPEQQVFRARFSAISAPEITAAMVPRLPHRALLA